jgi:K+/H+ antiporter YhaU regulatory subunit KhtT
MMSLLDTISDLAHSKFSGHREAYEVRRSVHHISARWLHVLSESEKKKVARILGGNRYAHSAEEMLQAVFERIVDDFKD